MENQLETVETVKSSVFSVENMQDLAKIVNRRTVVTEAGQWYDIQVSSVSDIQIPAEGTPYVIVNLDAVTPYHQQLIAELANQEDFTDAANVRVSTRAWSGRSFIPKKGEKIKVLFIAGETKAGEPALFVDQMKELPNAESKKFDLLAFMQK